MGSCLVITLASEVRAERVFSAEVEAQRQLAVLLQRDHAIEMTGHHVVFSRDQVAARCGARQRVGEGVLGGTTLLEGPSREELLHAPGDGAAASRARLAWARRSA
jgi:hypothetical protein